VPNLLGQLQYDRLAMTTGSTLNLNNASLDVSQVNGFSAATVGATFDTSVDPNVLQANGHIFFLITGATTVIGTFANATGTDPNFAGYNTFYSTDGQEFAISYNANFSSDSFTGGSDVAIMATPEPNSLSMLASSFGLALGLLRFRRRK